MKIEVCNSYEEISLKAKNIIAENLLQYKALMLCAATGGSPTRMYELLTEEYLSNPELFSQIRIAKLDEWGGLAVDDSRTCESYLQQHVLQPMQITDDRYISFRGDAVDPEKECQRIQGELDEKGPIDICILGIGMNGHMALNEPAENLQLDCHVAQLSEVTLQHPMFPGDKEKPKYGLTLGVGNIMKSKLVILLISGVEKREVTKSLLSKKITNRLPASLLWLHPNVVCLIDKAAAGI